MILRNEEECHGEGKAQRSGDHRCVEATGGGEERGVRGQVTPCLFIFRLASVILSSWNFHPGPPASRRSSAAPRRAQ